MNVCRRFWEDDGKLGTYQLVRRISTDKRAWNRAFSRCHPNLELLRYADIPVLIRPNQIGPDWRPLEADAITCKRCGSHAHRSAAHCSTCSTRARPLVLLGAQRFGRRDEGGAARGQKTREQFHAEHDSGSGGEHAEVQGANAEQ